jgi:23S rRNA pseudouridine1911/1915/1917 synthase
MTIENSITACIPDDLRGQRLDQALAAIFPEYSRNRLKQWILDGHVTVNGEHRRPRDIVNGGEALVLVPNQQAQVSWQGEDIPLHILYQDRELLVIDKAAGQVVHPAAGHRSGTLLNALLHYAPELEDIARAGIVHRLDKDTSGLLVVARSLKAQKQLVDQLQARSMGREYLAVVHGVLTAGGSVDAPIGRHPVKRQRMAVVRNGKQAVTHYRVQERFRCHTLVRVKLETGRTHQIRVHMAHIKHPLLGDPVYGGRQRTPTGADEELLQYLRQFKRQALHATRLCLQHPSTGETMCWDSPMPDDMQRLVELLRHDLESQQRGQQR